MYKIGLTGGIGSGKSTVAKLFEQLNIPVYYADDSAKKLMHTPPLKKAISKLLGPQAYKDNRLNVSYISGIVFDNKKILKALEDIVHPAVRKDFINWTSRQNSPYIVVENAILHKTGMDQMVDKIITVTAEDKLRIERLKKRDGKNEEELKKVMQAQNKPEFLLKNSDFIIENNGNLNKLRQKVEEIDFEVKKMLIKS